MRRPFFAALPLLAGLGAGASTVGGAQSLARAGVTSARVHVRSSPSSRATVVATVPRGTAVTVGACAARWCEVWATSAPEGTLGRAHGFAAIRYLAQDRAEADNARGVGSMPVGGGRGYTNAAGDHVPSPAATRDGRAPAGASAQCRDATWSFSASRRGTCSHHGGVARWL